MTKQSRSRPWPAWLGMLVLVAATLLTAPSARAEVAILIQGYLGNGDQWRTSGVAAELGHAGWSDAGHLRLDGGGVYVSDAGPNGARDFYTVALPTATSLGRQLPILERYVDFVRARHGGESLFILAHSAGGVLAQLYMVENPQVPVAALVTVASPHLGSEAALVASLLSETVGESIAQLFSVVPEFVDSRPLYRELAPERPGNFLYSLNRREHPPSRYVSVVRQGLHGWTGDGLVSTRSQDMDEVLALHGRATTVYHGNRHALQADDGHMLARILERLQST